MKNQLLLMLALVAGGATARVCAQTTNGVTTNAERQALNDAATMTAARQRNNAPIGTTSGSNTSSSSSSARPLSNAENEARINALFGFKTAAQKEAEARQLMQRYRDQDAAAAEKRAKDAVFNNWYADAKSAAQRTEAAAAEAAKPLLAAGLEHADAWAMSYHTRIDGSTGQPYGRPEDLAMVARATAARQAFLALYARPGATYEQLREVAGQLAMPAQPQSEYGTANYGVSTALDQYARLLERFPAHRASASADVLRAATAYFDWGGCLLYSALEVESGRRAVRLLLLGAANNPAEGYRAGARLAARFTDVYVNIRPAGTGFTGRLSVGNSMSGDSAQIGRMMRFCYAGSRQLAQAGEGVAVGLTATQLTTNAAKLALSLARIQLLENHPLVARPWLLRAVGADAATTTAAAEDFHQLAMLNPDMLWSLPAADWPRLGLKAPTGLAETRRWFADTVRIPDHARWQALAPEQRTALQEAETLAAWLNDQGVDARLQRATWSAVLSSTSEGGLRSAEEQWSVCVRAGSLTAARNLYRSFLLRGDKNAKYALSNFVASSPNKAEARYQMALLLLDELPGYPPLDKRNKGEGQRYLEQAAAEGSAAASARLRR